MELNVGLYWETCLSSLMGCFRGGTLWTNRKQRDVEQSGGQRETIGGGRGDYKKMDEGGGEGILEVRRDVDGLSTPSASSRFHLRLARSPRASPRSQISVEGSLNSRSSTPLAEMKAGV